MHSIIAVRGVAMAARVDRVPTGWTAQAVVDGVSFDAEGDTPEEASDALADKVKAST
jgi:hypothetical protein